MRPPVSSDPLDIMLAYDRWATRRLLELCRLLTPEQLHRRFPMGPGSLHDTLTHTIGCVLRWSDRIRGVAVRPSIEKGSRGAGAVGEGGVGGMPARTIAELVTLHDAASDDLGATAAEARRVGLGSHIRVSFEGMRPDGDPREYIFTRGAALMHVLNHGTHHRAQCLNILRRLEAPGVSDAIADFDVADWQYETECRGEREGVSR